MLVVGFPAGPWQTNCWVVAPEAGEQCIVIDPGHGAEQPLDDVLDRYNLQPVAVLLSHGQLAYPQVFHIKLVDLEMSQMSSRALQKYRNGVNAPSSIAIAPEHTR